MENKGIGILGSFTMVVAGFSLLIGCGNPPINVIVGNGSGQSGGQDFEMELPNIKIRSIGEQERECIGVRRTACHRRCDPCAPDEGAMQVSYYDPCADHSCSEHNTPEPAPQVTINNNVTCGGDKVKPVQVPKPVVPPSIQEGCRDN